MKVQNKGGKGNPNHDDNTGEFTSEGVNSQKPIEEDVGTFSFDFNIDNIDDFIDSIDFMSNREKDEKADAFISQLGEVTTVNFNKINQLSIDEQNDWLNHSHFEYDKEKLQSLTEKERYALLCAEMIADSKNPFIQEIQLLEKEKKDLENKKTLEIEEYASTNFGSIYGPLISGVWFSEKTPENFEKLNADKDENGKTAIDRKREYYENGIKDVEEKLSDPLLFADDVEYFTKIKDISQKHLNDLNKWVDDCQKYLEGKKQISLKYVDLFEENEAKYSELKAKSDYFNSEEYLGKVSAAKKFIDGFVDKNAAYSQFRKDNALWFKNWQEATDYFGPKFEKMWSTMTNEEQNQLVDYTGGGFSKYNKPLRGLSHGGWSGFGFAKAVTNLTNAINKCEWEEDIWVQRGISDSKIFKLPGADEATFLNDIPKDKLQDLVGMSFKDGGFYSAGAGKGTGFTSPIIFNTYCPKGTKMAFMNTKGHYAYGSENEMVLQRGYSYRITKVEKKGYITYIDCEVILGSNDDMITDMETLKKIGGKHLGY